MFSSVVGCASTFVGGRRRLCSSSLLVVLSGVILPLSGTVRPSVTERPWRGCRFRLVALLPLMYRGGREPSVWSAKRGALKKFGGREVCPTPCSKKYWPKVPRWKISWFVPLVATVQMVNCLKKGSNQGVYTPRTLLEDSKFAFPNGGLKVRCWKFPHKKLGNPFSQGRYFDPLGDLTRGNLPFTRSVTGSHPSGPIPDNGP